MGSIRRLRYEGTKSEKLVRGKEYTYKEYADEAGVGYRCMVSRLHGKRFVSDKELQALNAHKIPKQWRNVPNPAVSRFEHPSEAISQNTYLGGCSESG